MVNVGGGLYQVKISDPAHIFRTGNYRFLRSAPVSASIPMTRVSHSYGLTIVNVGDSSAFTVGDFIVCPREFRVTAIINATTVQVSDPANRFQDNVGAHWLGHRQSLMVGFQREHLEIRPSYIANNFAAVSFSRSEVH